MTGSVGSIVNTIVNYETGSPDELDDILTALANRHRREVVQLLAVRPGTIGQVAQRVGLTLPAIHRHIKVLEAAHLVRRTKVGRVNLLALERTALRRLQGWTEQFAPWWGTDAETLDNHAAAAERAADHAGSPGGKGTPT
ncbi:MAG TPA: winged helix-turn-helix domain-containing protein [Ornithinibacter sp.]|nr:winged helix-turn-helix domain-containing protein [Ornithinibacter sp.]